MVTPFVQHSAMLVMFFPSQMMEAHPVKLSESLEDLPLVLLALYAIFSHDSRCWIGDIRSRLVRLIPSAPPSSSLDAIRALLAYRLPANCSEREAREEWRTIVEGRSPLWSGIPNDRKETIRGIHLGVDKARSMLTHT